MQRVEVASITTQPLNDPFSFSTSSSSTSDQGKKNNSGRGGGLPPPPPPPPLFHKLKFILKGWFNQEF